MPIIRQGERDAEAVLAAAVTRDGFGAASGRSALATLSIAGSLLLFHTNFRWGVSQVWRLKRGPVEPDSTSGG